MINPHGWGKCALDAVAAAAATRQRAICCICFEPYYIWNVCTEINVCGAAYHLFWMHVCAVCTHFAPTHIKRWVCVIFLKSCELNNRQHSCCYNAHLCVVPMAFVAHFILLVFLFKLAIIDENSSIALNICWWSALLHYVWMYLFVHLSARWLARSLARSCIRTFVHSVLRL